jgi:plasmid stabilization system protein ParE
MPARLVRSDGFALDVEAQVDWLESHDELERLRRFGQELVQLETLLARFPEAGVRVQISGLEVRKALFSRLPFVVWYQHDRARKEVHVLRLFQAHQDRTVEPTRRKRRSKRQVPPLAV